MGEHLSLKRLADKSAGERTIIRGPGDRPVSETVVNSAGDTVTRVRREPWPLAGVALLGDPPKRWEPSDRFVGEAMSEIASGAAKWLELKNERLHTTSITLPSGPQAGSERAYERGVVMTGDEIVLHLTEGRRDAKGVPVKGQGRKVTVRYKVEEAPGIYLDDAEPAGYRVSHAYRCQLLTNEEG